MSDSITLTVVSGDEISLTIEAGVPGMDATITIGEVTEGVLASVTNSGTAQNAILDFVLPKGDKGDKGDAGVPYWSLSGAFTIPNNSIVPASITGLIMDSITVRSFVMEYNAYRVTGDEEVAESGQVRGIYLPITRGWAFTQGMVAGDAGIEFFIDDSNGQISLTSSNLSGSPVLASLHYKVMIMEN